MEQKVNKLIDVMEFGNLPEYLIKRFLQQTVIEYNLAGVARDRVGVTKTDSSICVNVDGKTVKEFSVKDESEVKASFDNGLLTIIVSVVKREPKIVEIL